MRWVSNITYTAQKNGFARTERSGTALGIVTESTQGLSMLCSGAMDEECGLRRRREKEMFWFDDAPDSSIFLCWCPELLVGICNFQH
jgi:hypothetical protein